MDVNNAINAIIVTSATEALVAIRNAEEKVGEAQKRLDAAKRVYTEAYQKARDALAEEGAQYDALRWQALCDEAYASARPAIEAAMAELESAQNALEDAKKAADELERQLIGSSCCCHAERRRRARLPAVSALTRKLRLRGNDYRGMIPGGEDRAAYEAAVQSGINDPDPVWTAAEPKNHRSHGDW